MNTNLYQKIRDRSVQVSQGTGYVQVDTTMVCVITRFGFRTVFGLLWAAYAFRRVKRDAMDSPGLLCTQLWMESWRTCTVFSLWENPIDIGFFNCRSRHIRVANAALRLLQPLRPGVHMWSAEFNLRAVSPPNLNWEGVDIEPYIQFRQRFDV